MTTRITTSFGPFVAKTGDAAVGTVPVSYLSVEVHAVEVTAQLLQSMSGLYLPRLKTVGGGLEIVSFDTQKRVTANKHVVYCTSTFC